VLVGINKVVGTEWRRVVEETIKSIKSRNEIIKQVESISNPFGDGDAGSRIAHILKMCMDEGLEIPLSNGRTSYPIYILKSSINNHKTSKVIAMYDDRGYATIDPKKARWFISTSPHSYNKIYKELYENQSIDI